MNSFEWIDAHSVAEAVQLLGKSSVTVAKAGGMDLLDLMKEGLVKPARVVNLKTIADLDAIERDANGNVRIGALATLAQIARDPLLQKEFSALTSAANHAATPQVRNVATLGGNLLQRPRCWYLRNAHFERAQVSSAARQGANHYHAIFDTERSPLVHASTPATALLAYDATVHVAGTPGSRSIPIREFFLPPDATRDRDVTIEPGEVLTHVTLPTLPANSVSAYHKQTERDSYDWPICDVAATATFNADGTIGTIAIALGWVAPTPMRATAAEQLLVGKKLDETVATNAARAVIRDAKPLTQNGYKVPVLETVIRRTVLALRV